MFAKVIRSIGKKQIAGATLLAMAAIGATKVPGHHASLLALQTKQEMPSDVSANAAVFGPNNLLGGGIAKADIDATSHADAADEHLVSGLSLSQADSELSFLGRTHGSDEGTLAGVMASGSAGSLSVSAVPEPAMAGLVAAMMIPAMGRRRRTPAL